MKINISTIKESSLAYMLLAPALLLLLGFMIYPIIHLLIVSFFETNRVGNITTFAGFTNYKALFVESNTFTETAIRTVIWTTLAVVAKTVLGLLIALVLKVNFYGRKITRTLVILPWASCIPISVMIWQWTLNNDFGMLNYTLKALGIWETPPIWLAYPIPAFFATLFVDIWLGLPFMALVFLAGMQAIPKSLYEAAKVEGATSVQQFFYITLPGIKTIVLIATLLSFLWTFNDFNVIYILTKGGPMGATEILVTYIYKNAFEFLNFGSASAAAVITFLILLGVSLIYAKFYFKAEKEGER